MHRRRGSLRNLGVGLLLLAGSLVSLAQENASRPHPGFTGRLAAPEILIGLREQLELSEAQIKRIRLTHERIKAKADAANREVKKRTVALNGYLENKEIHPDEAAEFLQRLTKAEAAVKRIHIEVLIEVDKVLTGGQREKLADLRAAGEILEMMERGRELQQRVQAKAARFQEQLRVYADLGGPPYKIAELAERIGTAMNERNLKEADKLLDKALAETEGK